MVNRNLFITQNSYYFVHRYFISIFFKYDGALIFVKERKRGIKKKYIEMIKYFGIINIFKIAFLESYFFFKLRNKLKKIESYEVDDNKLNDFLSLKLNQKSYKRIISIGCPCLIDESLQDKFKLKIYNLHGGIVPYQIGRYSPIKAILNGNKFLGTTLHLINNKFDNGEVISQDFFEIKGKNILNIYSQVLSISANLLENFLLNKKKQIPQNILEDFN